jgi:phage shock protein E
MKTGLFLTMLMAIPAFILTQCRQPGQQKQTIQQVTSTEAEKMIRSDSTLIVLDVRTADEFNQGHIKGALNIDIKQPDALAQIDRLNPDAIYLVHCRTNHRSTIAVNHMAEKGFTHIYQMSDGFSGWSMNGLPVVK